MNNKYKTLGACVLVGSGTIASQIGRLAQFPDGNLGILVMLVGAYLLVEGWTGKSLRLHIQGWLSSPKAEDDEQELSK